MNVHFLENDILFEHQLTKFSNHWLNDYSFFETTTSGSTGEPKQIRIKKKHAIASAWATIRFLELKSSYNALLCLNLETIGGKMMWIRSFVNNMNLYVIYPCANPLKNINTNIDFIALAPLQLYSILTETPEKLSSIKRIIVGGGEVSTKTIDLLKKHKLTVYQTFGMSETISHIALRKIGLQTQTYYTVLDHVSISTENEQLCIHAPKIGIERLLTNDRITQINQRQFIWHGRVDFVINSGGVKIQIEELEHCLSLYITEQFFVFPQKDEKLGEIVVLIVEGEVVEAYKNKQFYNFLSNRYHIPKKISFLKEFLWTKSNKINRIASFNVIDTFFSIVNS